jgi:hypothetical protein
MSTKSGSTIRFELEESSHIKSRGFIESVGELLVGEQFSKFDIRAHVAELESIANQRFQCDEQIFEQVVYSAPWLAPHARDLRQQCEDMGRRIASLKSLSQRADDSQNWRDKVRDLFEQFVELFLDHEDGMQNFLRAQDEGAGI